MNIDDETALWLWELKFGKETAVQDCKGRGILKGAYRQNGSDYGWDIYYQKPYYEFPQEPKGARTCHLRDFGIVHIETYVEKAHTC